MMRADVISGPKAYVLDAFRFAPFLFAGTIAIGIVVFFVMRRRKR